MSNLQNRYPENNGVSTVFTLSDQRRSDLKTGEYRAGGLYRTLAPGDHERVIRYIFGELRSRSQS